MAARPATPIPDPDADQREPGAARPPVRDFAGGGSCRRRVGRPAGLRLHVQPLVRCRLDGRPAGRRSPLADRRQGGAARGRSRRTSRPSTRPRWRSMSRRTRWSTPSCGRRMRSSPRSRTLSTGRPRRGDARRLRHRAGHRGARPRGRGDGDETALDDGHRGRRRPRQGPAGDPGRTRPRPIDRILSVLEAWAVPFKAIEARIAVDRRARLRGPRRRPGDPRQPRSHRADHRRRPMAADRRASAGSSSPRPTSAGPTTSCSAARAGGSSAIRSRTTPLDIADPLEPPRSVVRLHRALGDPTRMRILKLLAGRDLYATEIAQQLELSKPTIKHHLALLRAARVVTITESGAVVYYSLRRNRLDDASGRTQALPRRLTPPPNGLPERSHGHELDRYLTERRHR